MVIHSKLRKVWKSSWAPENTSKEGGSPGLVLNEGDEASLPQRAAVAMATRTDLGMDRLSVEGEGRGRSEEEGRRGFRNGGGSRGPPNTPPASIDVGTYLYPPSLSFAYDLLRVFLQLMIS